MPFFSCFQKTSSGQDLLDRAFTYLDIMERDYFGLKYAESPSSSSPAVNSGGKISPNQWLDPKKEIKKQSKAKGEHEALMNYNKTLAGFICSTAALPGTATLFLAESKFGLNIFLALAPQLKMTCNVVSN